MFLFILLGVVVVMTIAVVGVLFYLLNREGRKEDRTAVPVTDMAQLKKDLSNQVFEQNVKTIEKDSEIIPVFTPKVSLPLQETKSSPEDEAYKKRAQHLEDELLDISKKAAGQSDEARQMIEALTKENEELKSRHAHLEQAQQKLSTLEVEASGLKAENAGLQTRLETTSAQVRLLEDQMAAVKVQMGEEIARANATVSELKREKDELVSAPKPPLEADEALRQELESLRSQQAHLRQKCEDLQKANEQLQYELIKAKAQASGLERISFNYKNQLEELHKKMNTLQTSHQ